MINIAVGPINDTGEFIEVGILIAVGFIIKCLVWTTNTKE